MILMRDNLKDWPVFTALVTPFDQGKVDYVALKKLINQQVKNKCGLVILGSTAEAFSLTEEEKKKILSLVLEEKEDVPVIVGASGPCYQSVKAMLEFLNDHEIQGVLLSLPPYYRPGLYGQKIFFQQALSLSRHPIVFYNHPGRVGISIDPFVFNSFQTHPNLLLVKQSDPNVETLRNIHKNAPQLPIYLGDDSLLHAFRKEKIQGLISVMANAWPAETRLYTELCLQDKSTALQIFDSLEQASNPIPIKKILSLMFGMNSEVRLPLSAQDLKSPRALEDTIQKMQQWWITTTQHAYN
jgi:4-hydroxy-tetrahydrodipicolinate synthase